jgi:hypothetical protein
MDPANQRKKERKEGGKEARPDECVHSDDFDFIQALDSVSNLPLVGSYVNNESQRVAFFDLFHCGFCCERMSDDAVFVEFGSGGSALSLVFGVAVELEGLGTVEVDLFADFDRSGSM